MNHILHDLNSKIEYKKPGVEHSSVPGWYRDWLTIWHWEQSRLARWKHTWIKVCKVSRPILEFKRSTFTVTHGNMTLACCELSTVYLHHPPITRACMCVFLTANQTRSVWKVPRNVIGPQTEPTQSYVNVHCKQENCVSAVTCFDVSNTILIGEIHTKANYALLYPFEVEFFNVYSTFHRSPKKKAKEITVVFVQVLKCMHSFYDSSHTPPQKCFLSPNLTSRTEPKYVFMTLWIRTGISTQKGSLFSGFPLVFQKDTSQFRWSFDGLVSHGVTHSTTIHSHGDAT